MDSYIYKEHRLSKIEEMFRTVFTSKAIIALVIMSFIVCTGSMFFAVSYLSVAGFLTLENLEMLRDMFPEFEGDISDIYESILYSTQFMGYCFILFGAVYLWLGIGAVMVYRRSNVLDSKRSPRSGFTVIQALGITKLVFEGFSTFICAFIGLGLLTQADTFIAGIFLCIFVAVNFMYTVSTIVFCKSVKRTIDGVLPSSSGSGPLQFSAMVTGIFMSIVSLLIILMLAAVIFDTDGIPQETKFLNNFVFRLMGSMVMIFLVAVVHFLIFAIVRHYAKKLPMAMNAEQVYRQNMSNLYPEQQYLQNQPYQQMQNNGYVPYQQTPQNSYNGYMPYSPPNSQPAPADDLHPQADYTQYPPYDPTKKY